MAHILPDLFGMMLMMHLRTPTGPDGGFNLKESFRCRFAAGEKLLIIGSTFCCWSAATLFSGRLDFTAGRRYKARLDFGC
jgi:hypothetical protein